MSLRRWLPSGARAARVIIICSGTSAAGQPANRITKLGLTAPANKITLRAIILPISLDLCYRCVTVGDMMNSWTSYQQTEGLKIQRGMGRILAGIARPTLEQIQDAAFVAELELRSMSAWTDEELRRYSLITGQVTE